MTYASLLATIAFIPTTNNFQIHYVEDLILILCHFLIFQYFLDKIRRKMHREKISNLQKIISLIVRCITYFEIETNFSDPSSW